MPCPCKRAFNETLCIFYDESEFTMFFYFISSFVSSVYRTFACRDLKPENLLYESKHAKSRLLITDFGLAHLGEPGLDETMVTTCGTPEYIAPEVLMRTPYINKVVFMSLSKYFAEYP